MNDHKIVDAIQAISEETNAPHDEIIDALIGVCFDEEDAGQIHLACSQ